METTKIQLMKKIAKQQANILIIEDSTTNVLLISSILEDEGFYKVASLGEGKHALKHIKSDKPNLILLDINLPNKMNGFKVLELLKADADTKNIPVIIISALTEQRYIKQGKELGALEYLPKPINIDNFVSILNNLFV